ncbi:MarR family transcriptional regulator [Halorubrum sp. DTA98]|uniref:MarR family transcriptional regulator n=1 Tax=Halorubrum sp. DTA98 TaxID=3402163 RepID=UPI003AAF87AD
MPSEWNVIGYVISSKYRLSVLRHLSGDASTPTQLAATIATSTTHVSRALRQLREWGLVSLAVPDDRRKNRVYELTGRGESVWETIRANDLSA